LKRVSRISLAVALILTCLACMTQVAAADGPLLKNVRPYVPAVKPSAEPDKWTFAADKVVGDNLSEFVEGTGNCSLSMGDNQLEADFIRYYHTTGWVYLKGNLRARWGGDFLQAEEGEFDLSNMTGWLLKGKVFMAEPHLYVDAERVNKSKGDSYSFKNAKVTACDGETPAWSVSTGEGDIELDGRVHLFRSTFNVKDVPAFYWPYLSLPGRQDRASGFLTPYIASSSKLGLQANLPYYWVINEESDVTFYQNYMSDRGYMQGVEYRHVDDVATKGLWKVDGMYDDRRASSEADEWKDYNDDGLARPNRNRWWLRSKYDGWISDPKVKVKLDLDMVSDQNYMRDFQNGPSGFDESRDAFLDAFGRDIENKDDYTRTSVALVTRSWDKFGTAGKVQYVENLEFRNGNGDDEDDTTVQTVPELEAFAFQQGLSGTPLEVVGEAKYDYFYRRLGHTGQRLRLTPTTKLPVTAGGFTFIPYAGVDYTGYSLSRQEGYGSEAIVDSGGRTRYIDTDAVEKGSSQRVNWNSGVTAFTELSQVFDLGGSVDPTVDNAGQSSWTKLKHSIIPRLSYDYVPVMTGQDKYPYFDEYDRIGGENAVTYSLTNVLDRRRDKVALAPGGESGPNAKLSTDYLDFFNFRLAQSYDWNEATRNDERDEYERRPFSDLLSDMTIKPGEFVSLTSRVWYSFYKGGLTEAENTLKFFQDGLGEVWLGYDYQAAIDEYKRYRDDNLSIIEIGARWEMTRAFSLRGKYRHDFEDEQDLERSIGLTWQADCYSLDFLLVSKPNDNRFEFNFNLASF